MSCPEAAVKRALLSSSTTSMFGVRLAGRLQSSFARFQRLKSCGTTGRVLQEVSEPSLAGAKHLVAGLQTLGSSRPNSTVSFPPPPPQPTDEQPVWTSEIWASPLDVRRRVFCNRSLNMKSITAVGFDMDYTLAQYKPEAFEGLAHTQTIDKLVKFFGYPELLYDLQFDWRYMTRGLVIDKRRGNMIKVDRHKYVKLAYHGFKPLSREERMSTYNDSASQRDEFDEPEYALIDTLFSLAEAHLFMQLVEVKDAQPGVLPPGKSYADLYRDVRGAVDLCHRDGTIKREVAAHPEKYIHEDPLLVPLLDTLHQAGKKVFLATNSMWDYTHVVMNYVLTGKKGRDKDEKWLEYFDAVVTGCGKPRFFSERGPLFEVHTSTGMLYNTEGGSPMIPIGEDDLPTPILGSTAPSNVSMGGLGHKARVFQGGYYLDLHKMLGVQSGSQVLYVGDHIYGDVLRSKKALGWRTLLVIPELETELDMLQHCKGNMAELKVLRQQRDALDDQIQRLEWALKYRPPEDVTSSLDMGLPGSPASGSGEHVSSKNGSGKHDSGESGANGSEGSGENGNGGGSGSGGGGGGGDGEEALSWRGVCAVRVRLGEKRVLLRLREALLALLAEGDESGDELEGDDSEEDSEGLGSEDGESGSDDDEELGGSGSDDDE